MHVEEDTFQNKLDWSLWRRVFQHALPYKKFLAGLSVWAIIIAVCGLPTTGFSIGSLRPSSISWISWRIDMSALQNRSSSLNDSLSVGSIIKVPGTGKDKVGA